MPRTVRVCPVRKAIKKLSPIRVGTMLYRVEVVPDDRWMCNENHIADVHYDKRTIHLRDVGQPGWMLLDNLLHECLHAVVADRASGQFESPDLVDKGQYALVGELFTKAAEQGLVNLFLDNPRLLALFAKYWTLTARRKEAK